MQDPRRQRRLPASERRGLLLDRALSLFAERGYGAVSVGEIAEATGVTKPVIYEHFESKADLYVRLVEREAGALHASLAASFRPEVALESRLKGLVESAIGHARRHPEAVGLLIQEPPGEAAVAAAHERARERSRAAVASAILLDPVFEASPGMSRRASAELHADLQVAMLERVLRWALGHPRTSSRALADFLVELLGRGIGI
jgi:AcrR family transcriptional regulator